MKISKSTLIKFAKSNIVLLSVVCLIIFSVVAIALFGLPNDGFVVPQTNASGNPTSNEAFGTNVSGWSAINCTLYRLGNLSNIGTYSMIVYANGTTGNYMIHSKSFIPRSVGDQINTSFYITPSFNGQIAVYCSDGNNLLPSYQYFNVTANTPQHITQSYIAPQAASTELFVLANSPGPDSYFYISNVVITDTPSIQVASSPPITDLQSLIDANAANGVPTVLTGNYYGLTYSSASGLTINVPNNAMIIGDNFNVQNIGFHIDNVSNVLIEGVNDYYTTINGLSLVDINNQCNNVTVTGCTIDKSRRQWYPIWIDPSYTTNITITNNTIIDSDCAGICVEANYPPATLSYWNISNNYVTNCGINSRINEWVVGIDLGEDSVTLENGVYDNNVVTYSWMADTYIDDSCTVINCTATNDTCNYGGQNPDPGSNIHYEDGFLVHDLNITGCTADNEYTGLYFYGESGVISDYTASNDVNGIYADTVSANTSICGAEIQATSHGIINNDAGPGYINVYTNYPTTISAPTQYSGNIILLDN
jgi:hypothetical protein